MQQRYEAANGHIQAILTFTATISFAAPTLATAVVEDIDLTSPFFIAAIAIFSASILVGAVARASGDLHLISPELLYEGWLHDDAWEFKKNAIFFAGEDFKHNRRVVNTKTRVATAMMLAMVMEIGLFLAWVLVES
ncbi:MAG: hypothetical protein WEB04_07240 [Dehalococcoidia bacterium]